VSGVTGAGGLPGGPGAGPVAPTGLAGPGLAGPGLAGAEARLGFAAIPEVPGVLSAADVLATAGSICEVQQPDGMIPWFPGGHCDPWNHVESAMALTVCGFLAEARRAYEWLARSQLADGSWFNYYWPTAVKDQRLDTNVCAYVAAGLWHYTLVTGDPTLAVELWPMVEGAIEFVLRWQRPDGAVRWSVDAAGVPEAYALLTGSSSVYHSLRCALALAETLGEERPGWELAAGRLGHAVAHHQGSFAPKDEFAMDWYYPVLCGALQGAPGRDRLVRHWSTFVLPGAGVRCVSSGDWVTAAETAECVLALEALGMHATALELFAAGQELRLADGSYWTGLVFPSRATFPAGERTTYTAAAMVLAADALADASPAAGLFRGEGLPAVVDLSSSACEPGGRCPAPALDFSGAAPPA